VHVLSGSSRKGYSGVTTWHWQRVILPFSIRLPNLTQKRIMNFKLLLRTIFLVLILLLLVIMGMNNRQTVSLSLPPILPKMLKLSAAIMYFAFFAVDVLSGTLLVAGKKGGSSGKGKTQK
jgi:hypothetical protein